MSSMILESVTGIVVTVSCLVNPAGLPSLYTHSSLSYFFFWKLIDEEKGTCILQFLFIYYFAYQSRVGVDLHISKKPSQQWSKNQWNQCNQIILIYAIYRFCFENVFDFQVIWRHKMVTVFQKCAVFLPLFLINRILYLLSKNKLCFVSPICSRGFFLWGVLFESLATSLFLKNVTWPVIGHFR